MDIRLFWMIVAVPVTLLLVLFTVFWFRMRYAKRRVRERSREDKITELNRDLEPFGFFYEEEQDIICAEMNPWQREMGYCRLYDVAAPAMNMAIQSEPIYFNYNNRRWLIEFWKGQYGMTTGGEVGMYVTDKEDISIPGVFQGPFFSCVKDEERIPMELILYRNRKKLFERQELHWWLTAFAAGMFSKPKQLSMDIRLTFPNRMMQMAFVEGLREAGYREGDYLIYRNTVQIHFAKPKTSQPYRKQKLWYELVQCMNRLYCSVFRKVTGNYVKTLDKIDYLRFLFPVLYRIVIQLGKPLRRKTVYDMLRSKAEHTEEVL